MSTESGKVSPRRVAPDCTLDAFDVEPGGDVFLSLGDSEGLWHGVVLSAATVAGIAEASAAARRPPAEEHAMAELGSPATATLKVDWDAATINAVRAACLAVAEVYESYGSDLPGWWNLSDAVRLRSAAEAIRSYVDAREQAKQAHAASALRWALQHAAEEESTP